MIPQIHFYDQMLIDPTMMDYNKLLLGIIKVIFFREANSPQYKDGTEWNAYRKKNARLQTSHCERYKIRRSWRIGSRNTFEEIFANFQLQFFSKILKLIAVKSFVWPQQKGTFIADIMDCRVWLVSQHLKHNLYYYLHDKELI